MPVLFLLCVIDLFSQFCYILIMKKDIFALFEEQQAKEPKPQEVKLPAGEEPATEEPEAEEPAEEPEAGQDPTQEPEGGGSDGV